METFIVNTSGGVRRVVKNGREYLVADATILRPGVLNGSQGPLYYPPDEIAANPGVWNGYPLTAYHPQHPIDGRHQSADEPGVWDRQGIGFTANDRILPDGRRKVEAWFDAARTQKINPTIYNRLLRGEPIEVSTGLYTDNVPAENGARCPRTGRPYTHVARNYRPNHLAVLPDQTGACSVADGCGVLVNGLNQNAGGTPMNETAWMALGKTLGVLVNNRDVGITNEKRCPKCGGEMDEDGECEDCGYTANANRHQDTGQYLPAGGKPATKQTATAARKGRDHRGTDVDEIVKIDPNRMIESGEEDDHQFDDAPGRTGAEKTSKAMASVSNTEFLRWVELAYNRDWPQAKRDALDKKDFAGPHQSFPISSQTDVDSAAHLVGKADDPGAVKGRIKAIAKRKGLSLPESWAGEDDVANNAEQTRDERGRFAAGASAAAHDTSHKVADSGDPVTTASGREKLRGFATDAKKAAAKGDSAAAGYLHGQAATLHRAIAATASARGHEGAAQAHQAAAQVHDDARSLHRGLLNNAFPSAAPPGKPPAPAQPAPSQDTDGDDDAQQAPTPAAPPAKAPPPTAKPPTPKAKMFQKVQKVANSNQQQGTDMALTRDQKLAKLTANCKCEKERKAFPLLNDATLDVLLAANAKAEGSNADAKGSGSVEAGGYNDDDNIGDYSNDDANLGGDEVKIKKKAPQMSENQWFEQAPESVRNALRRAARAELREKQRLVAQLTAHLKPGDRKDKIVANLMAKTTDDLEERLALQPPTANQSYTPRRDDLAAYYLGQAGGPAELTDNAGPDPDDPPLDIPTLNYTEISQEWHTNGRVKATAG